VRQRVLVGSRGSALALAQANEVIKTLRDRAPNLTCQVVAIKTKGDKLHESGESTLEGKSVFTKEIEDSLLNGEIQIAVHSMKDLTTDLPSGLTIAAVPRRADHRDALISRNNRKLEELPAGARVGTSSPRRRTQLLAARNDLEVADVQGNVNTRLRKLDKGSYDTIVLAAAGLARLGLEKRVTEFLSTKIMLPAIGQGALAIEARKDDAETLQLLSRLEDKSTHRAVEAERAFARRLGANCRTPIAAYAKAQDGKLAIEGMVSSADGRMLLRSQLVSDNVDPEKVGEELAESLLRKGAQFVLEAE
jgi:hydroxymethylbilane synthase